MSDATAFDYPRMRDTADRLLIKFGQNVLLRRTTNTGGTAWEPITGTADYATTAAIVNLPRWYPSYGPNSDVLRTDRMGLISAGPLTAQGITPTPFDRLVDAAGQSWKIIDIKPIYPAGLTVVYIAQLRV